MSQTWVKSLDSLKNSLPLGEFSVWVKPLGAIEKNSTLHLLAPSASALKYINNHKKIKSAIVLAVAEQNRTLKMHLDKAVEDEREHEKANEECKVGNEKISQFECSIFDGKYVTDDIDDTYLKNLEDVRNDKSKLSRKPAN